MMRASRILVTKCCGVVPRRYEIYGVEHFQCTACRDGGLDASDLRELARPAQDKDGK